MRKMVYLIPAFEKLTVLIISTFSILSCTGNKILCGACLWNWAMYHDVLYCSSQASHYLGTKEQIPIAPSNCKTNKEWLCQDSTLVYQIDKNFLNYTVPGLLHWQEAVKPDSPFLLVCYLEINCTAWCTE